VAASGSATSFPTFLRKLNSTPNREFEKVVEGYAVNCHLRSLSRTRRETIPS
jgi:hypothetical protein